MFRDFGPGLTVDELIGLTAFHISHLKLPPEKIFQKVKTAAKEMVNASLESSVLTEIWEDGHTSWIDLDDKKPTVVTPGGQLIRTKKGIND
jgi:hypothetical protein